MNRTRQTNTFSAGLNMDVDYSLLKEGQYIYAENIRILTNLGSSFGAMQNIEGFLDTKINLTRHKIIHVTTVRDWAIVFTTNEYGNNDVFRIDFSNSEVEPQIYTVVSNIYLGITTSKGEVNAISSVCRWESSDNVKVYFADGHNQVKVINVDDAHNNANISKDSITLLPAANLPVFEFEGFGGGALTSGMVQYCYQLFNTRGTETSISPLTQMIHLASSDAKSNYNDVVGDGKEKNTGKSVKLAITNVDTRFDRAKIIAVYYKSNTAVPEIIIIDDVKIYGSTLRYEDKGSSVTSQLSIDEFNMLTGYTFTPEVIEAKDNRLFAANITEDTWDVEYDARAYRANQSGTIRLLSNSANMMEFSINDISTINVPKDYDCICPYNSNSGDYQYAKSSTGENIKGGTGVNVSYCFVTTDLIEDASNPGLGPIYAYNEEYTFNTTATSSSTLPLYYEDRNRSGNIYLLPGNKLLNYSNAEIDAKLKGYFRDEIYRFGIVLYNDRGQASPVHWIADIRMPSARDGYYKAFSTPGVNSVVTHPLGVEFDVRNLPSSVVRYEIVRCERTMSDRTILSQGVISNVIDYNHSGSIACPFPYLAYSTKHGYYSVNAKGDSGVDYDYDFPLSDYISPNLYMFVSPEVCINKENANELVSKFNSIQSVATLTSPIVYGSRPADTDVNKVFANPSAIKDQNGNIKLTASLGPISNLNGFTSTKKAGHVILSADNFYSATLAKYYENYPTNGGEATVDNAKIAVDIKEIYTDSDTPWSKPGMSIDNVTYYNWVYQPFETAEEGDVDKTDANNVRKVGPHGVCAIFSSSNIRNSIPLVNSTTDTGNLNAVILCNMKQNVNPYGGNSYSAIQNSVYINTGANGSTNEKVVCYGGDTYINILDYVNMSMHYRPDDKETWSRNRHFNAAFIPCESSINLALRSDDTSLSRTYVAGSGYANHFAQTDICNVYDIYSQSTPLYAYNDAYSAQPRARKFVSKSIYNIDNLTSDSRIMASELKTNNEVIDSWSKFKVANYIDLDTKFGPINEMTLFRNQLLFWQTDAFGSVAVNERSLITDGNPGALTLGTGGILDRYDYFTTLNGLSPNQLRVDTQSDGAVYWYDAKRNEICGFNGQLQTVSKLKGVQSYLNSNREAFSADPVAVYDKKYNEVLFTLANTTLVFNEQLGAFTSFYTYKPDYYADFSDKLYLFKDLKLYKYNSGETTNLDNDKAKVAYMRFVVNADYPQTKTFDNVEYAGNFKYKTNFDNVYFETKRQTSYTLTQDDIDYREDTYKFCIPRNSLELNEVEQLANKSYKDRMKGKYLICNYKYDCNNGSTFKVPYISTAYRHSLI